jgi:hypothetical protein
MGRDVRIRLEDNAGRNTMTAYRFKPGTGNDDNLSGESGQAGFIGGGGSGSVVIAAAWLVLYLIAVLHSPASEHSTATADVSLASYATSAH